MSSNAFSAADMTTAAANGFRDGLAAQPAAAQEAVYQLRSTDDDRAWVDCTEGEFNWWQGRSRESRKLFAAAPVAAAPIDGWDAQAYGQMAGELEAWKLRAVTAEGDFNRLCNAMNAEDGPTHMGEPVLVSRSGLSDQAAAETQASGWKLVCELLTELSPGWANAPGSGLDLALAAIRGLRVNTPAAPGTDLAQFKDLIGFAAWSAINLPETDPRRDFIRQASELLALIDASPKGGSCATCNDNGLIGGPSFYQPDEGGIPCPDCVTKVGVTDTQRLDWLESEIRHYGDGQTEPREAYIGFNWQQGNGVKVFPGLRSAIDAEMQATSAEVGG